jgi:CYTH domain-containing protein
MSITNEIERKFIVKEIPKNIKQYQRIDILQKYISIDPEIRIRQQIEDGEYTYYKAKKSNDSLSREQDEVEISSTDFYNLSSITMGNDIVKVRYLIPVGKYTAELDIYQEKLSGLLIVEVEFKTVQEAGEFVVPNWFRQEVTYDKRYKNKNLSKINSIKDL